MAHTEQTKLQFIELRAQEKTLEEISIALNVCKRTLVDWNREFADDIADLREVERESLCRKLFGTISDWMKSELDHYKRLNEARRQFKYSPTESVFRMRVESRKTIEKFLFAESPLDRPRPKRSQPDTLRPDSPISNAEPETRSQKAETTQSESTSPVAASASQPETQNSKSEITTTACDESIVVDPNEPARSILERCGLKLPNDPNIRLVRAHVAAPKN
jgi:hypothetical protein